MSGFARFQSQVGLLLVDCPTQLILYLYLSVVFYDKYQSLKYEEIQQGNLLGKREYGFADGGRPRMGKRDPVEDADLLDGGKLYMMR